MKKLCFLVLALVFAVSGCSQEKPVENKKLRVVASIYPMAEFVRAVGKERVTVAVLVPPGTEAHDWQPSAGDLKEVQAARLFVYNGGGMDPWAPKILSSLGEHKPVGVEAGKGLFVTPGGAGMAQGDGHDHDHDHAFDPHIWLDPLLAVKEVEAIRDALVGLDGKNANEYRENSAKYIAELQSLDADYRKLADQTKGAEFVTMHAAFGYLARQYGWRQIAVMGLDPHAEPTPAALAALVNQVKERKIRYLFAEPQISDKSMREVAKQAGAELLTLDPLETPAKDKTGDYIKGMRQNLAMLEKALPPR